MPLPTTTFRATRAGQYVLSLTLLCVAGWMMASDWRRGLFGVALVPVALVPFSAARLRAQKIIEEFREGHALSRRAVEVYTGLALLADAVMLLQLLTSRSQPALDVLEAQGVMWVGPVWFSANALLLLGTGLIGLGRMLARVGGSAVRALWVSSDPVSPFQLERRQFLKQAGLLGVGTPFIVSLSGVELSYDFRVQERHIVLPNWPRAFDGLRVAHLSDIHVGGAMNRARLLQVAALTNGARPDLVLHTGDFLTHRSGDFDEPLYEALERIRAPYGQWACLGNHDFDDPARLVQRLRAAGVTTLRDRSATLSVAGQQLEVAGMDFVFGAALGPERFNRVVGQWAPRTDVPRLLLNHDPRGFAALPDGCADLVCSGHTHGGHIGVQFGPDHALTVIGLLGIPDQGLFYRRDMRLFVTRCVGFYGYPMRLGIPPEIALLVLRSV
jgi:predicted MPP superfamily phosphohydrolase